MGEWLVEKQRLISDPCRFLNLLTPKGTMKFKLDIDEAPHRAVCTLQNVP